jgi:hypothetical protein
MLVELFVCKRLFTPELVNLAKPVLAVFTTPINLCLGSWLPVIKMHLGVSLPSR